MTSCGRCITNLNSWLGSVLRLAVKFMVAAWYLHKSTGIDDDVSTVACGGALFRAKANLLRDTLRRPVVRIDDRDQAGRAEHGPGEIARGGRGLRGVTTALQRGQHV